MQPKHINIVLILQSLTLLILGYWLWASDDSVPGSSLLTLSVLMAGAGLFVAFRNQPAYEVKTEGLGQRRQGLVKWFNPSKGFGFIEQDSGDDLFVHQSEIQQSGFRYLNKGDRVEFEIGTGKKGPVALNVIRLEAAPDTYLDDSPEAVSRAS